MRIIFAIAMKDLKLLFRDRAGSFFTFFFPLLIALFFGTIFSGGGGGSQSMKILAVDQDQSPESEKYIRRLTDAPELRVEMTAPDSARDMVRRGKRSAYILLKPGFGAASGNMFFGDPPEIELGVDPSRQAEKGMLTGLLTKYAVQGMQENFSNTNKMRGNVTESLEAIRKSATMSGEEKNNLTRFLSELDIFLEKENQTNTESDSAGESAFAGFEPLKITTVDVVRKRIGPGNSYTISFAQGVIWAILGTAIAFGISLVLERNRGTLVRLKMSPLSERHILAGKALACFNTIVGVSALIMAVGVIIFNVRPYSYPMLAGSLIFSAIAFVGIMMTLSVIGKTEQAAGGLGWAVLMVMAMFGGGMVPTFIMPVWMQNLGNFSPVKWAMLSIEGALWRNFTFSEMLTPYAVLLGIGVFFFILGSFIFSKMERA